MKKNEKRIEELDNKMINAKWLRTSICHAIDTAELIIEKAKGSGIIKNAPINLYIDSSVDGFQSAKKVRNELEKIGAELEPEMELLEGTTYVIIGWLEIDLEINAIIETEIDLSYLFFKHRGNYDRQFIDLNGNNIKEQ